MHTCGAVVSLRFKNESVMFSASVQSSEGSSYVTVTRLTTVDCISQSPVSWLKKSKEEKKNKMFIGSNLNQYADAFHRKEQWICGTHHTLVTLWSVGKVVTNTLACVLVTW